MKPNMIHDQTVRSYISLIEVFPWILAARARPGVPGEWNRQISQWFMEQIHDEKADMLDRRETSTF